MMSHLLARLRKAARALKGEIVALSIAARDPRTPFAAKALAAVVVAYALSPIDLIPDFIPVLGQIDDLILVPLGLWLAIRLIPGDVLADARARAVEAQRPSRSRRAAMFVVAIWIASIGFAVWLLLG